MTHITTLAGGGASPEVLKVLEWVKAQLGKADQVVEEWHEGANFCRRYSSGFIEQGGVVGVTDSKGATISFRQPFQSANYSFQATPLQFASAKCYSCYSRDSKTASSINVTALSREGSFGSTDIDWFACGY